MDVGEWGAKAGGNLWRTDHDIRDTWASMAALGFDQRVGTEKYAGPGHWNDPDMLEIGNGGMSMDEYRVHMSLWSILASPLMAGNDVRDMPADILAILTNKEVIAVDQDSLGKQGDRVWAQGPSEIWTKPLSGGAKAIALFNRAEDDEPITLNLKEAGVSEHAKLRDLWQGKEVEAKDGKYTVLIPRHGAVLLKASR
jgi:alpha-galactosidase